jgi:hypothetical protein
MPARRIVRDVNEDAPDVARALAKTEAFEQSCRDRKRVEMLFAHLKRILRLGRLRPRGPRPPDIHVSCWHFLPVPSRPSECLVTEADRPLRDRWRNEES